MKIITLLFFIGMIGDVCWAQRSGSKIINEVVLSPGESIQATNKNGIIQIFYTGPLKRKYKWNGKERTVKMIARQERFAHPGIIGKGVLGIYNPADTWFFSFGPRLVVEEAQRYFESMEDVYKFLHQGSEYMDWVYTSDGLVVGFGEAPSRKQVNISLFQVYINGEKPTNLEGAKNWALREEGQSSHSGIATNETGKIE